VPKTYIYIFSKHNFELPHVVGVDLLVIEPSCWHSCDRGTFIILPWLTAIIFIVCVSVCVWGTACSASLLPGNWSLSLQDTGGKGREHWWNWWIFL